MSTVLNIAAYKFAPLDHLPERRQVLRSLCAEHQLKGTIMLSEEGINLFIAGVAEGVRELLTCLRSDPLLADLYAKESYSDTQPFSRMLVKLKKEIIAFGIDGIDPAGKPSPHLPPAELKSWLDEGRDFNLLDVRNDYEVRVGTFEKAEAIGVDHFRDFPQAIAELPETWKEKPLVMFCTGGIRCEKAGPLMQREGFDQVFQLNGGILQYFDDCGGAHYDGDCFVFDQRVALNPQLQESNLAQCYACLQPLFEADQASEYYIPGESCPYCANSAAESQARAIQQLEAQIADACRPLPGSIAYENRRPINVPLRLADQPLLDFLDALHPHIGREVWAGHIAAGRICIKDQPASPDRVVQAGEGYVHLLPDTVEPDVATDIRVLYVDDALLVLDKPAPLPVHPCGRYNLNSLAKLLKHAMPGRHPRLAHRLDANTSGLLALTFSREAARVLQPQFADGRVSKRYRARIHAHPETSSFVCEARIGDDSTDLGGRDLSEDGRAASTRFEVVARCEDGSSLVWVYPDGGRTHQIRLHAWELGHPIVGDPCYLPEKARGDTQTLAVDAPPMCLQAAELSFAHPASGDTMRFSATEPGWWS
jgi:UPF0176 protein